MILNNIKPHLETNLQDFSVQKPCKMFHYFLFYKLPKLLDDLTSNIREFSSFPMDLHLDAKDFEKSYITLEKNND